MFTAASLKTTDSLAESLPEMPSPAAAENALPTRPLRTQRFKRFGLAALLLLATGSGVWAWQDAGYEPLSAVSVGNIGSCEVKFVASYHKVGPGEADLAHLKNMLAQNKSVRCTE
ncbi:hypothetical protein QM309_18945, partial [Morganella morganii]|nr:hypothetical protein [Morganella morganii]